MRRRPTGFTLLETLAASAVLAALTTLTLQVVLGMNAESKARDREIRANLILGNLMEELATLSWDELDAGGIDHEDFAARHASALPEAEVKIETTEQASLKRITVELTWRTPNDLARRTSRLTSWVSRKGEAP